jgi:hypothetical protein
LTYKDKWLMAHNAYFEEGGFADGSYIDKFKKEDDEDYKKRCEMATYINYIKPKVEEFTSYIFKEAIRREFKNKNLQTALSKLDTFIKDTAPQLLIRGCGFVLVNLPKKESFEEQLNSFQLEFIAPEKIKQIQIAKNNIIEWIIIEEKVIEKTPFKGDTEVVYEYYYDSEGYLFKKNGKEIDKGTYAIKFCPVLMFSENNKFPTVGKFTQIAELTKDIYNKESEENEVLREQAVSILAVPIADINDAIRETEDGEQPSFNRKADSIMFYTGNGTPGYIAPSNTPTEMINRRIEKQEKRIEDLSKNPRIGLGTEAAEALKIRYNSLNSSVKFYAHRLQELEKAICVMSCKWLNIKEDSFTVEYPKSYNIATIQEELEVYSVLNEIIDSQTYRVEKKKEIISLDLPNISDEVKEKIFKEL